LQEISRPDLIISSRFKLIHANDCAIYANFHSLSAANCERVAIFLAKLVARNGNQSEEQSEDDEFALLCAKRAAQAAAEQN
jgi:hypothetical protein